MGVMDSSSMLVSFIRGVTRRSGVLAASVGVGCAIGVMAAGRAPASLVYLGALAAFVGVMGLIAWRKPTMAIVLLVSALPFQHLVLAWALSLGVNIRIVSLARFWKDVIWVVLVLRLVMTRRKNWTRVDGMILVFLGLVCAYVIIPLGPEPYVRVIAARQIAAFLALFLVARHLSGLADAYPKVETAVLISATVVAALAFWNTLQPDAFKTWIDGTGLNAYSLSIHGVPARATLDRGSIGGLEYVRAGSTFLFPVTLAYYLLIPVGLVIGRIARGAFRNGHLMVGVICAGGLVLTLTRSAAAAVPFMFVLALLAGRRRTTVFVLLAVVLALAVPLLGAVTGGDRLTRAGGNADSSSDVHLRQLRGSLDRVESKPLGSGLGTAGGISQRFEVTGGIVNESWYLQVGTELGVTGMLVYTVVVLSALGLLWRASAHSSQPSLGSLCALAGIALGGLVLHTLEEFSVAWTVWLLAGLSLRSADGQRHEEVSVVETPARVATVA